jgi:ribosome recycling factor
MNPNQVVTETKSKLDHALDHFKEELKKLRTGRAHPGMLDSVKVSVYGQEMPLKAVGNITAPEAQLLQITPFDPSNLQAINNAIRDDQSLGLSPTDDGRVVRITIPPLTTETRAAMVKIIGQKVEDCMITSRQIRHEAFRRGDQAEKDKEISKDERIRFEKQVDELLAKQKTEVDALSAAKEKELMTI